MVKNKNIKIFLLAAAFLTGGVLLSFDSAFAQTARQLDVAAYIADKNNDELSNGKYDVRFAIYAGDALVWQETQNITISNGMLLAYLGAVNPLPDSLKFDSEEYALGIKIGSDNEMTPRKKIGAVPMAINSQYLQGAAIGTKKGDIPQLGNGGKMNIKQLPTGTGSNKLVLGDDDRLHSQNTDTGTDSLLFNLGSDSALSGNNFDIAVSNESLQPTLRFNGTESRWQFSNDGSAFSDFGSGGGGNYLDLSGGTMTGDIVFSSTQTFDASDIASGVLAAARGGTGINTSASTGIPTISTGTWSVASNLSIALGGTNAITIGSAGSVPYSTGTAYAFSAAGTSGQVLLSGGTGAPTWGTVSGGVIAADSLDFTELSDSMTLDANLAIASSASNYSVNIDSSTLFVDTANNRVGVGKNNPSTALDVSGTIQADSILINGQATLGYLGVNVTLNSSLIPSTSGLNLGSSANHWATVYVDNLSVGGTDMNGTTSEYFTINTDATTDENVGLRFYRSAVNGYAALVWNATDQRFNLFKRESTTTLGDISLGTIVSGTWNGTAIGTGYLASAVMLEGENISLLTNDSAYITDGNTNWDNSYGYITASSADTLTNKTWNGTAIGAQYGGTGINTSASTGIPTISTGTWSVASNLGITLGGTNATAIGSAGSVPYSTGTAYAFSAAGTSGQTLISGGAGSPTWYAPTAGSILFAGASGILQQDNAGLFWDDTNNRLGVGTASPSEQLTSYRGNFSQTLNGASPVSGPLPLKGYISDSNISTSFGIYVSGKYAYVTSNTGRLFIFDVSNPSSPSLRGSILDATNLSGARKVVVSGKYAYITAYGTDRLTIVDISNPASPSVVGSISDSQLDGAFGLYISGKYAYVTASLASRVTIVDISNPSSPSIAGSVNDATRLASSSSVYVSGKYAYATGLTNDYLSVIDISNPASPSIVGSVSSATQLDGAYSVYVSGRYAYVVSYTDEGLSVVDISNPASPSVVGSVMSSASFDDPKSVYVSGRYAYVAGYWDTTIVDISNPSSPSVVAEGSNDIYAAGDIFVSGKYVYIVGFKSDTFVSSLGVFDLYGIDSPGANIGDLFASSIETSDNVDIGNNLFVRSGLNVGSNGILTDGRLSVSDVSYFAGNVGIGDTSPDSLLDILSSGAANTNLKITNTNAGDYDPAIGFELAEGTHTFTMGVDDSDGDKFKISTTALGTNDRFTIDSSGNITMGTITSGTWNGTAIGAQYGGTGIDTSASTGVPTIATGTWSVASNLGITLGGTNATTIGSAGSVPYSTGTAYAFSGVGTTGQALISGGAGSPTWYAPTAGSILFAGTGGILQQDNASLFWDDTNNRLGIGTASPGYAFTVSKSITTTAAEILSGNSFAVSPSAGTSNYFISNYNYIQPSGSSNITGEVMANENVIAISRTGGTLSQIMANYNYIANVSSGGAVTNAYASYNYILNATGTLTNTYGVYVADITSGTQTNTPFSFYASDASAYNYFAGNVGIGDTTPASLFTVGNGDLFQVNSSGVVAAGTWNGAAIGAQYGGTGINTSASTGVPTISAGTWSIASSLGVTMGGTGTTTQFTQGSLVFAGASGVYSQDNASLFFDDTNNYLGVGTATPSSHLEVYSGTADSIFTLTSATASTEPMLKFRTGVTPAVQFSMGVDTADSNKFKIFSGDGIASTSEFSIDTTGLVSIANMELGAQAFADNAGAVSLVDMAVTSAASNGTVESYTAYLDGNAMITVYGTSDGAGSVANLGVGIGDTTPDSLLDILSSGAANTNLKITNTNAGDYDPAIGFELAEGTHIFTMGVDDSDGDKFKISTTALGTNDRFVIDSVGNVGIGTATPSGRLHSYVSNAAVTATTYDGYFENLATNATTDAIDKYGIYVTSTGTFTGSVGTATNNYGIYLATTSGGDNNYQIYDQSGAYLSTAGTWTNAPSYRRYKDNYVGTESYLDRLMTLDVYEWQYKNETVDGMNRYANDPNRHTSPFLDDFYNVFRLGTDKGVNVQDMAGVALASVKELNTRFIAQKDLQIGIDTEQKTLLESITLKTDQNVTNITELQISIDTQLGVVAASLQIQGSTLAGLRSNLDRAELTLTGLKSDIDGQEIRLKQMEDLSAILQQQIADLQKLTNQDLNLAQLEANTTDLSFLKTLLGLDRATNPGDVDILGKFSAEVTETGVLQIKVKDEEARTIGEAVIYPVAIDGDADGNDDFTGQPMINQEVVARDGKSVAVKTKAVSLGTKVFVTPKTALAQALAVTETNLGESFKTEVLTAVTEPVKFDWVIIEEK